MRWLTWPEKVKRHQKSAMECFWNKSLSHVRDNLSIISLNTWWSLQHLGLFQLKLTLHTITEVESFPAPVLSADGVSVMLVSAFKCFKICLLAVLLTFDVCKWARGISLPHCLQFSGFFFFWSVFNDYLNHILYILLFLFVFMFFFLKLLYCCHCFTMQRKVQLACK